jgi:hypothetical protein
MPEPMPSAKWTLIKPARRPVKRVGNDQITRFGVARYVGAKERMMRAITR